MKQICIFLSMFFLLFSHGFSEGNEKSSKSKFIEMVTVAGGIFMIGGDGQYDGKPIHEVTVSGYKMSKTEVTQALYQKVMGKNPSYFKGDNLPVEQVSWYDAIEFCNKLSTLAGLTPAYIINKSKQDPNNNNEYDTMKWTVTLNPKSNGYRLPTEAQWEFSARGGTKSKGYTFAGANDIDEVAWYNVNLNSSTHEVATKAPNELGLYDMSGNVWEWCFDRYADYDANAQTDPEGDASGGYRIDRGGSWGNFAERAGVASRNFFNPESRINLIGFRVVLP